MPTQTSTNTPTILYTVDEACEQLRIGRDSLYQLINTKKLRSLKIGKRRLIAHKDIQTFVDSALQDAS